MKMKKIQVLLLSIGLLFSTSLFASQETVIVLKKTYQVKAKLALTEKEQEKGLGGVKKLAYGKGMLFPYSDSDHRIFWMKGMFIPIDIIWINKGKVVHIENNVQPPQKGEQDSDLPLYGMKVKADRVLEVPAGYAASIGLQLNDIVQGVDGT